MDYDNGTECQNCGWETCNGIDCADIEAPDLLMDDEQYEWEQEHGLLHPNVSACVAR